MIGPVKNSGSICSRGRCSGKGWWRAGAARAYLVMPAGHQRRNMKVFGSWPPEMDREGFSFYPETLLDLHFGKNMS